MGKRAKKTTVRRRSQGEAAVAKENHKLFKAVSDEKSLDSALNKVGKLSRSLAVEQAAMDAAVSRIAAPFLKKIEEIKTELHGRSLDATTWALANRLQVLAAGTSQTRTMPHGTVAYKVGRPKVIAPDVKAAIAQLFQLGKAGKLGIRFSETLDKAYLGKQPELVARVEGLSIVDGEWSVTLTPTKIVGG